jgi:glycosyltransferase involved in cell wall biosynthesis
MIAARVENIHLLIIGRGAKNDYELQSLIARRNNIEIYDNVPSVIPYLKGALVSVVPLLHGSGTRLKIIESMACSKPIVSTTIGAEGLGAKDGRDIFIADEPKDFAEKTVKLIHDEKLQNKMGESAYRFVKEKFGFEAVGQTIHQMIASIVPD